jgi:class 3 adenylate cyclase
MTNPVVRFWRNSLRALPSEERFPFLQEAYFSNYYRARIFAIALFAIHLVMVYVDFQHRASGLWTVIPGYRYLFDLHVVIEAVLVLFIVFMTIARPANPKSVRVPHIITVLLFVFFILVWAASVSAVDQEIHGQITVYTIALFGIAVAFYVSGATSFLMYLAAHAYFMVGITRMQSNPTILLGHYLNGTALVVVAWVLSRLVFSSRVKEFIDTRTIERQKLEIEEAKDKTETILKNILPETIVKQINGSGYPPPQYNASTTIVFADFVSFYKIAESSDAREVLKILEEMFNAFDGCVRRHNLEKLKTIGDCYMFAGGLFAEDNQLEEAVEAALEIREEVRRYSDDLRSRTGHDWALRIGIHTGPAITGIIGTWRFIYDVWGPTVNIASRLEAASLPHKINVSQQVYDSLRRTNKYTLEPRGALAIKNMQAVEMYFVERKKEKVGQIA